MDFGNREFDMRDNELDKFFGKTFAEVLIQFPDMFDDKGIGGEYKALMENLIKKFTIALSPD